MRRIFTIIVVIAAVAALAVGLMVYTGSLRLNHPTQPVHGVDVSHYQGEIDWPVRRKRRMGATRLAISQS